MLCEYCFSLFGVGIIPDVNIKEFSCLLKNNNINDKEDNSIVNDCNNCV